MDTNPQQSDNGHNPQPLPPLRSTPRQKIAKLLILHLTALQKGGQLRPHDVEACIQWKREIAKAL